MFKNTTYIKRRVELCKNLETGFILLLGHQNSPMNFTNNAYSFIQDTNFLYYLGVDLPNCACLIDVEKNKTIFYMNEKTVHDIIWIGKTKSVQFWGESCGADEIKPLSSLSADLKNKLNITFANEQEIFSLIGAKNFNDVITFGKQLEKIIVITRGEKGSIAIHKDEVVECDIQKNLKIVDLTGAGDLFAAGFLHGHVNKLSMKESLKKGTEMSSKIIQKIGARLN